MSGPPRHLADARRAVREVLAALEDTGGPVLVACSGGADSLALAAVTAFVAPRLGMTAGAVVVDHGMQHGSEAIASRAAEQCAELGLAPVVVHRVDVAVGPGSGGPEAAARLARYSALDRVATQTSSRAVLLGHTADDQAETVLLGLARGSGARSLAGMRPVVGRLRRPFLGLRRADTEAICRDAGLDFWTDPTNDGAHADAPLRSRVRDQVMPVLDGVLGPGVVDALVRTADQLDEDDEALTACARELLDAARPAPSVPPDRSWPEIYEAKNGGAVAQSLDISRLLEGHAAVRRRALRAAAIAVGASPSALTRGHILEVDRLLTQWRGQGPLHLPGGVRVRRDCGRLVLEHLHN